MKNAAFYFILLLAGFIFIGCASIGNTKGSLSYNGFIQWIGGPTTLIHKNNFTILTDPMFGPKGPNAFVLPKHPSTGEINAAIERLDEPAKVDFGNIDLVLLSHLHADHFDETAKQKIPKNTLFIASPAVEEKLKGMGFTNILALKWGDSTVIENGGKRVTIKAIEAHHAHDSDLDKQLGEVNGYTITFFSAKEQRELTIYWAGDTVPYDGMKDKMNEASIDVLLADLGAVGSDGKIGRRSMNAEEAIQLLKMYNPKILIPIHHSSFGHYRESIEKLRQLAHDKHLSERVHILKVGEKHRLL